MTKLDAGLITPLPASDSGRSAVWGTQPSILAITETRLKENQTGPHTNLCNYTFVSNSRSQSRGEGVGLYVNCSLNFTMRPDLIITHEKIFESLFIEIESNNSTMICGVIYRPPSFRSTT